MVSLGLHDKDSLDQHTITFEGNMTVFIHENYSPTTMANDITLIHLNRKVKFNDNIKPICLPKPLENFQSILTDQIAVVAGT